MRLLLIGASGYTGFHLATILLESGHSVSALGRAEEASPRIEALKSKGLAYLGAQSEFAGHATVDGFDAVVCLAGYAASDHAATDVPPMVAALVGAPIMAMEAARNMGVPVVLAGSYWQYLTPERGHGINLYATLKASLDGVLAFYKAEYDCSVFTLVLADTYGPIDWRPKLIPTVFRHLESGEALALGSPLQVVAPIFIGDVVDGILSVVRLAKSEEPIGDVFQLLPRRPSTVQQVVAACMDASQREVEVAWNSRPMRREPIYDIVPSFPSPPLWTPRVSLRDGVRRVWQASAVNE